MGTWILGAWVAIITGWLLIDFVKLSTLRIRVERLEKSRDTADHGRHRTITINNREWETCKDYMNCDHEIHTVLGSVE